MRSSSEAHVPPIVAFYSGQGTDSEGRSLHDIRGWGFDRLESVHDYIQWLFPLRVRSQFNPDAPLLDEETIRRFQEDARLLAELKASFEQMLAFYGFVLSEKNGQPVVSTGPDWDARQRQWLHFGDHNLLRITRILTCLGTLGLPEHARAFLAALETVCAAEPGVVGDRTLNFWRTAIPHGTFNDARRG